MKNSHMDIPSNQKSWYIFSVEVNYSTTKACFLPNTVSKNTHKKLLNWIQNWVHVLEYCT